MLWKNPNELFGQSNILLSHMLYIIYTYDAIKILWENIHISFWGKVPYIMTSKTEIAQEKTNMFNYINI